VSRRSARPGASDVHPGQIIIGPNGGRSQPIFGCLHCLNVAGPCLHLWLASVASIVTGLLGSGHTVDVAAGNRAAERQNIGDDGHSRQQPLQPLSSRMRTGIRWTTLVKLPVALSGGGNANHSPARSTRRGRAVFRSETVNGDVDRLARYPRELRFLVIGHHIDVRTPRRCTASTNERKSPPPEKSTI
jgi:hypothetical protein